MPPRRTIWMLTDTRAGDLAQLRHLATLLRQAPASRAWQVVEKRLTFRAGSLLSPGAAKSKLDWSASGLTPPWPDAVLAVERTAAWIGASIKRRSAGAARLIVLGRMAGDPSACDLILATPQFAGQAQAKAVMLPVPLAAAPPVTAEAAARLAEAMAGKPRPWTLWAIGGSVAPDRLDASAADDLATAIVQAAEDGAQLVFTSPRTGEAIEQRLRGNLDRRPTPNIVFNGWRNRTGPNLFPAAMAQSDRVVATSDSISMAVEAIAAEKSVSLYRLPQHHTVAVKLGRALAGGGPVAALAAPLLRRGIIEPPPDRAAFFASLIGRGWLADYPAFAPPAADVPLREAERLALAAIHGLLA